jgi:hypothetical protein
MRTIATPSHAGNAGVRLDELRRKLIDADAMLDHGLRAIHHGSPLDAMENVYAASCLIEEITRALDGTAAVETRTSC